MTPLFWRLLAGAISAVCLSWSLAGRRRNDLAGMRRLMGVLGLALFVFAALPNGAQRLARWPHMTRIRLLMAVVSVLVMTVNLEAIRRSRLRERYALLWIGTSLFILAGALYTGWLNALSAAFGMQYVSIIVAVIFTFLVLVAFQFSVELSRLDEDRTRLAQRLALLEERLTAWTAQAQQPGSAEARSGKPDPRATGAPPPTCDERTLTPGNPR